MIRAFLVATFCLLSLAGHAHERATSLQFEQRLAQSLPLGAMFVDETGRREQLGHYFGQTPVVILFGYLRCPNLCDTTLAALTTALQRSRLTPHDEYRALFVSIDPDDTASGSAKAKHERIPLDERTAWHFLTSARASITALAQGAGFRYAYDADRLEYEHPAGFVVVTPAGVIARYFLGAGFDPEQLRTAILDAGRGRAGGLAAQILLLCRHLDASGRYTNAIMAALRIFVLLCLAAGGALIWRLSRRRQ